jgi:hypothetical protein
VEDLVCDQRDQFIKGRHLHIGVQIDTAVARRNPFTNEARAPADLYPSEVAWRQHTNLDRALDRSLNEMLIVESSVPI